MSEYAFPTVPSAEELAKFPLNDLGNAMRFIRTVGGEILEDGGVETRHCRVLYVRGRGWMAFNGKHWDLKAGEEQARRWTHKVAADLVAQGAHSPISGKPWAEFVSRSGSSGSSAAMLAQAAAYLSVDLDVFDPDPLALAVRNGVLRFKAPSAKDRAGGKSATVDFRKGHAPDDRITRMADADWDPGATAPLFDGLWAFAQPRREMRDYLRALFGYIATGSVKEQLFAILQGKGGDGKSTLVNAIAGALGTYSATAGIEVFLDTGVKRGGEASPELARLAGATRLVCTAEPPRGSKLNSAMIKAFTGGGRITARELRQGITEFEPLCKVVLECNSRPVINDTDDGIWRRIRIVLFEKQVKEPDKDLPEKLKAEKNGILNWVAQGVLDWLDGKLVTPASMAEALDDYRLGGNAFAEWFSEHVVRDPEARTLAGEFWGSYKLFCEDNGYDRPMTQATFGRALGDHQIIRAGKSGVGGKALRRGGRLKDFRDRERHLDEDDPFGGPGGAGGGSAPAAFEELPLQPNDD